MTVSYAHLLIVSEDPQRRAALCAPLLERQWYAFSEAADLPATLAVLAQETVDVLLVDVDLATAGESRFIHAVRAADDQQRLIILLIAPAGRTAQVRQGLQAGANDWLTFPTDPVLLKTRCDLAVQQRSLQEQLRSSAESFQEMMHLTKDLRDKILPLGVALTAETDFDRLLERILREAKAICRADAGALFLVSADNSLRLALAQYDSLQFDWPSVNQSGYPFARLPLAGDPERESSAQDVLVQVAVTGRPVNIADIAQEDSFSFAALEAFAAAGYQTISLLAVPLRNERVQGVLLLMNAQEAGSGRIIPFSRYHLLVTESLVAQGGVVMHNHVLRERAARLRRLQEELRIGRQIQFGFFPTDIPQPAGWEIAAHLHPAREVGGDFYDVFTLPGGQLGFVVGDVCGKGVGAALFMALIRTLIRAFIERDMPGEMGTSPAGQVLTNIVTYTNHYIIAHHGQDHMFSTLFIGLLQPDSGVLHYVNAGHVPPLVWHSQQEEAQRLARNGPAVGLVKEADYQPQQRRLVPGAWLLVYTDGVSEARNAAGEPFGVRRLEKVVGTSTVQAEQLLARIDEQVARFTGRAEPQDDVTMLALHCLPR
jgi:serine phosphatase RsbU (regulator of sigma subunit)/DNA-binding response OmpR family regulator